MTNPDLMTSLGAASAIFLTSAGSAIASIQAGIFALRSGGGIKAFIPITQAGVLAVYGIIIAVLLCKQRDITESDGYKNLAAGLSVGLSTLMSGVGMSGFLGKHMKPTTNGCAARGGQEEPLIASSSTGVQVAPISAPLILVMVFLESIGLYGLIVALILSSH